MKNTRVKIALAASALSLTLLLSACQSAAPVQTTPTPAASPTVSASVLASYIDIDDAKNAALQAASVTEENAEVSGIWLIGENENAQYAVQFHTNDILYQYNVNAVTGEAAAAEPVDYKRQERIEALEREAEATAQPTASPSATPAPTAAPNTNKITAEEAKAIAYAHAGINAADLVYSEAELEWKYGTTIYDVEFVVLVGKNYLEYDYDIDSESGKILSYGPEVDNFNVPSGTQTDGITLDKAKEIALADAGVAAANASFTKAKPDYDDGIAVFDVEFFVLDGNAYREYDYEIRASDGFILSKKNEGPDYVPSAAPQPGGSQASSDIGLERAKEIALAKVGISAADAAFTEAKPDYDDGRLVYELEFVVTVNGTVIEYEYKIAAADGTILKSGEKTKNYTPSAAPQPSASGTQTTGDITVDKAKEIALTDAGISAANATFVKAEKEYDDGVLIYEIEFIVVSGNTVVEHDYEIRVSDGVILKRDPDIETIYTVPGSTQTGDLISEGDAKALVLAKVPGATEADIVKWKKDFDDGRWIYEGEIVFDGWEYEFEIDATTGTILDWDPDSVFD